MLEKRRCSREVEYIQPLARRAKAFTCTANHMISMMESGAWHEFNSRKLLNEDHLILRYADTYGVSKARSILYQR